MDEEAVEEIKWQRLRRFSIDDDARRVIIVSVAHRREVYRK